MVRGILELRVDMRAGLAGFDALAGLAAFGVLSTLGVCLGLAADCLIDLRVFGLKADGPDAGRIRLFGSGLLVESDTCAQASPIGQYVTAKNTTKDTGKAQHN